MKNGQNPSSEAKNGQKSWKKSRKSDFLPCNCRCATRNGIYMVRFLKQAAETHASPPRHRFWVFFAWGITWSENRRGQKSRFWSNFGVFHVGMEKSPFFGHFWTKNRKNGIFWAKNGPKSAKIGHFLTYFPIPLFFVKKSLKIA